MQQTLKNLSQFITKNWFSLGIIALGVLLVVGAILSVLAPTPPPNPDNQWHGVAPGFAFSKENITAQLGEPLKQEPTANGTKYSYESVYPLLPHEVLVDKNNTVTTIKEYLPPETTQTVAEYEQRLGKADLELYIVGDVAPKAHIFLKTGLITISYPIDGIVREKWYITPTTEELFFKTWGEQFSHRPIGHAEPVLETHSQP